MSFVWSYSALDVFEQCPKRFYHKYILKEKEPPSPALEYGNAVHKACEEYLTNKTISAPHRFVEIIKRHAQGKKCFVEQKMGLDSILQPIGFFDVRVWGRAAADVLIVDYPNALFVDWKTGKMREGTQYWKGPTQLIILALFIFKHFPRVEKITAFNIYLDAEKIGEQFTILRSKEPALWGAMLPKIQAVEQAILLNKFPMMPGPLCGYCPVKQCPNNRS